MYYYPISVFTFFLLFFLVKNKYKRENIPRLLAPYPRHIKRDITETHFGAHKLLKGVLSTIWIYTYIYRHRVHFVGNTLRRCVPLQKSHQAKLMFLCAQLALIIKTFLNNIRIIIRLSYNESTREQTLLYSMKYSFHNVIFEQLLMFFILWERLNKNNCCHSFCTREREWIMKMVLRSIKTFQFI